jgi:peptide/nickel transport system ATP-binding protein
MQTERNPRAGGEAPVLRVDNLQIELTSGGAVVEDLSLSLSKGEIVGLVGESGSGKTTTALAMLGYCRPGVRIAGGQIEIAGERLTGLSESRLRGRRGRLVSYVPQDPANSLNPAMRVARSIKDVLDAHASGEASVGSVLRSVHLPDQEAFARRYPHQLSGGQQQRITIGMALSSEPALIVLDEPTTGLDVITQARILEEIQRLRSERSLSMLYVSHDLAVVGQIADRIAVMYAGRIVEQGTTASILSRPRHPYTRGLIASVPDLRQRRRIEAMPGFAVGIGDRPVGCPFSPRCRQAVERCKIELPQLEQISGDQCVRCFEWIQTPPMEKQEGGATEFTAEANVSLVEVGELVARFGHGHEQIVAVDRVSFSLARGECLALVGESGSGKTTIARCIAGLHVPASGRITLDGRVLPARAKDRPREARRRIQIVFQNPYDSLNPRHTVGESIARPMLILRGPSKRQARAEVDELLERVRLPTRTAGRLPRELSGGERQRVAIARALAAHPDVLISDEITSALDVSVQAAVLSILDELRRELGLSVLLITHNLGIVTAVADRVVVLEHGRIREQGTVSQVMLTPADEYTRQLIEAAPRLPDATAIAG